MRALILLALCATAHAAEFDGSHPVSIAAREAVKACKVIEAESIEDCAASSKKSPEHTAARLAARKAYEAHAAYADSCKGNCRWKADALVEIGIANALK